MDRQKIKKMLQNNPQMTHVLCTIYNHFPFNNKFNLSKKNKLKNSGILKNCIVKVNGSGNCIYIDSLARVNNTIITIKGNNNQIFIGKDCLVEEGEFYIEDDGGSIEIGAGTEICGKTHLAVIEGTKITIGEGCLFSSSIIIRTGDSHSILDMLGNRINPSQSVHIGNRVWIGNQVTVLKGSEINSDCIVGTGALVTKQIKCTNVIIAGAPAKIIKENICWCGERIQMKGEK